MALRNKKNITLTLGCVLLASLAGDLAAEEEGALGMKVGSGSRLLLSLGVGTFYSNNYYYQDTDEESAIGLLIRPSALLLTDRGALRYQFSASAEAGAFDLKGDADDYVDGALAAKFDWQPLTRHFFSGGAGWRADHDPFGTRRTESSSLFDRKLDRWEQPTANLLYRFGAPQAKLNLEAELVALEREYTTNRSSTQFLDYDSTGLRGTAYYKISSKTSLLAEVIGADIDYDVVAPGFPSRAGDVTRYRVGARWLATGKISGDVRFGRIERKFDSSVQDDYDEFDWQVGLAWEPRARDRITLTTGREPEESYLNAARLIDNQYYKLGWAHDWTSQFRSQLSYSFNDLDYLGVVRQDDVEEWSLGLEYKPSRRWALFSDIAFQERDSNVLSLDYDNTIVSIGIRLTY